MALLELIDLHVQKGQNQILKGVNLTINDGEIHVLLGPNGHGKTTCLLAIMGQPDCIITQGKIIYDGVDITTLEPDERARRGIFLSFQNPVEVAGVNTSEFLKAALNARRETPINLYSFFKLMQQLTSEVDLPLTAVNRDLNDGFSGGEKKKNELLQLKLLAPRLALLDEIDSGLDVDATKKISQTLIQMPQPFAALIVSHYNQLFNDIAPTHVHLLIDGKIKKTGDATLLDAVQTGGFDQFR